jgi:hypothetical protein
VLQGLVIKPLVGIPVAHRASVYSEAQRLRETFTKAELRKLTEMLGVVPEAKPVVRVVERYYRGVPEKVEV